MCTKQNADCRTNYNCYKIRALKREKFYCRILVQIIDFTCSDSYWNIIFNYNGKYLPIRLNLLDSIKSV